MQSSLKRKRQKISSLENQLQKLEKDIFVKNKIIDDLKASQRKLLQENGGDTQISSISNFSTTNKNNKNSKTKGTAGSKYKTTHLLRDRRDMFKQSARVEFIHNYRYSNVNYVNKNTDNKRSNVCCNFKVNTSKVTLGYSTVIFKPTVEVLVNSKNNINKSSSRNNVNSHKMRIKLTKHECNHKYYKNGGYNIQCGLICIPKFSHNPRNKLTRDQFEKEFKSLDNNYGCGLSNIMDINESWKFIETYYIRFGYFTDDNRYWCYFGHNNNYNHLQLYDSHNDIYNMLEDTKTTATATTTSTTTTTTSTMHHNRKHSKSNGSALSPSTGHNYNHSYNNSFNKNNNIGYRNNDEYCFKKGDLIELSIDYNKEKGKYYLCFLKNGNKNKIIGKTRNEKEFVHGRLHLDFDKYDYFYGLASVQCICKENVQGFEFEVEMD